MKKDLRLIVVGAAIVVLLLALQFRYTISRAGERGIAYKLDRWTGKVWMVYPGGMEQLKNDR